MNEMPVEDGAEVLSHKLVMSRRGPVRIIAIQDEEWIDGEPVAEPESFIRSLPEHVAW